MRVQAWLAALVPLLLYTLTAAPDVTFIDSGELAAAAATLGIAHPTGYPLFTLLGRLATVAPLGAEPIARLTLLSALWAGLAVAVASLFFREMARTLGLDSRGCLWTAVAGGWTLGLGATLWSQATIVEVYGLAFLFVTLLLLLAWRASVRGDAAQLLFGYAAGLAVTTHGSTAPLVPILAWPLLRGWGVDRLRATAIAVLAAAGVIALPVGRGLGVGLLGAALIVVATSPERRSVITQLAMLAGMSLLGLSIYLYLPIRSGRDPLLDWGDPENPGAFWRHISGKVFHVWFLASIDVARRGLTQFGTQLVREWTPVGVALAGWGIAHLWKHHRDLALWTTLLAAVNITYAINYDIHDIQPYFLPALLVVCAWLTMGMARLYRLLSGALGRNAALAATFALPALAGVVNLGSANQRSNYLVADYTRSMFDGLEPDAVILSRQWDTFCSAAIYEQAVRGRRQDVTVLEKELLRRRWYLSQLERWDPSLVAACTIPVASFEDALAPFEEGEAFDAHLLQTLYVGVIQCLLEAGEASGRPIYLTPDAVESGIGAGFRQLPTGLAMRLVRDIETPLPPAAVPEVRGLEAAVRSGKRLPSHLAGLVLEMITRRAMLEASTGDLRAARQTVERALAIDGDYRNALALRANLEQLERGELTPPPRAPSGDVPPHP